MKFCRTRFAIIIMFDIRLAVLMDMDRESKTEDVEFPCLETQ